MSLTEETKITFELDENGLMHIAKKTRILKDGLQVGSSIHREVLKPESKDYTEKISKISQELVGQTAIDQQILIAQRDAEISKLKKDKTDLQAEREQLRIEKAELQAEKEQAKEAKK